MIGLERVSGVAGSLLLNLEAVFTMALALALFGEHVDRRATLGAGGVVVAAAVLGLSGGSSHVDGVGIIAIAGACACWAVDNNLTQRLSGRDPLAIVRAKAAVAGAINGVGGSLSTWADRLRIIRRAKLRSLLTELDELLRVFPRMTELDGRADPIPLGDGSVERKQWDRLVSGRALVASGRRVCP